jgi:uncharacterized protein YqgV (UPF0045/DUF77 family)
MSLWSVEASLYPLDHQYIPAIEGFIAALAHPELTVTVSPMSTRIEGPRTVLWERLERALDTLEAGPRAALVLKVLTFPATAPHPETAYGPP